jgi:hypothetical protein
VGNDVAFKHGLYARRTPEEQWAKSVLLLARHAPDADLPLWIYLSRVAVSKVFDNTGDAALMRGWGVWHRHVGLVLWGMQIISKLVVRSHELEVDEEPDFERWVEVIDDVLGR